MNLSDMIEQYIRECIEDHESIEIKRNEIASRFQCVPSQINYVIATRFIPELGFCVESRRGGGGYIRISRMDLGKSEYISKLIDKIGKKMSQSVVDIYLKELLRYNILDEQLAALVRIAVSDQSLIQVEIAKRDFVRADIFKHIMIKMI